MKKGFSTLSLCLLAATFALAESKEDAVETRMNLTLTDGSVIKGTPGDQKITLHSALGKLQIPINHMARLVIQSDREKASVTLRNRDMVSGVLDSDPLQLDSLLGPLSVGMDKIESFRVFSVARSIRDLQSDLIFYFPFDEEGGSLDNEVDVKLNARVEKAAWTPEGVVGGAYTFNEVYKYIQVDNTDVLSPEQVTAACWIYPTGHSGYHGALIKSTSGVWGDGYGLTMYSGDSKHIYFFVNAYGYYRVKAPIEMNQWAHLVGTYDGKEVRIYKNGKLIESMAYKAKLKTNTSHLYIGQGRSNGYPWPGAIDEAMLFRRALSAQEVTALYDRFPHP